MRAKVVLPAGPLPCGSRQPVPESWRASAARAWSAGLSESSSWCRWRAGFSNQTARRLLTNGGGKLFRIPPSIFASIHPGNARNGGKRLFFPEIQSLFGESGAIPASILARRRWKPAFFPVFLRRNRHAAKMIVSEIGTALDSNVPEASRKPRFRSRCSRPGVSQILKNASEDWRNCDPPVTGLSQGQTMIAP